VKVLHNNHLAYKTPSPAGATFAIAGEYLPFVVVFELTSQLHRLS
jgi:hypothetical protein